MKDISVVVVTYNPSYDNLISTLQSIIWQENIDFEIIIADDGSIHFDKEEIEAWLVSKGFRDYKFVLNSVNHGTMKNAISGWSVAEGKYIKQLSPGDMLYDKNTLEKAFHYIEGRGFGLAFGLAAAYQIGNGHIRLADLNNPRDLRPYYANNRAWIKASYLIKRDYVNGMAYIARRDLLLRYSKFLEDKVKYAEDCTYILMIADDVSVGFIEDYIIWYEYGTGISTSKNSLWRQRISADNLECFEVIGKLKPKYMFVRWIYTTYEENNVLTYIKKIARKMCCIALEMQIKGISKIISMPEFHPDLQHLEEIFANKSIMS